VAYSRNRLPDRLDLSSYHSIVDGGLSVETGFH
jgi:hypothetical protein